MTDIGVMLNVMTVTQRCNVNAMTVTQRCNVECYDSYTEV